MDFSHVSVLLKETVGNLITDPNGIYVGRRRAQL